MQTQTHGMEAIVRRGGPERGGGQLQRGIQRFAGMVLSRLTEQESTQLQSAGANLFITDHSRLVQEAATGGNQANTCRSCRPLTALTEPADGQIQNLLLTRRTEMIELPREPKGEVGGASIASAPRACHQL